jgi:phospholipase/carboxylesterase
MLQSKASHQRLSVVGWREVTKLAQIVGAAAGVSICAVPVTAWSRAPPRLETIARGPATARRIVLLHGLGSSAAEWRPFVDTIAIDCPRRFVLPEGHFAVPRPDGRRGYAWWPLVLDDYVPIDGTLPDLAAADPRGLRRASIRVGALLTKVASQTGRPAVLAGFSQGAMVASDVAFTTDSPLAALVSVTPIHEAAWRQGFARRKGTPIFVAHGREDRSLSFEAALRLREEMQHAGLTVTWFPFEGGHDIPAEVIAALNEFFRRNGLFTEGSRLSSKP